MLTAAEITVQAMAVYRANCAHRDEYWIGTNLVGHGQWLLSTKSWRCIFGVALERI